ncbi:MAG: flavodoxin [Bacilli bacterium]|nr:flavodoxin [Bacilli bacterium]
MKDKKILIAYFSHGGENLVDDEIVDIGPEGNTCKAAKVLAKKLEGIGYKPNLFEINTLIPYPHDYDGTNARARQEKEDGALPLIDDGPNNFELYDIVFLGYPNWWGTVPAPINSFLRDHDTRGKTIVPFVTHGGQMFMYSLDDIASAAPGATIKKGFAVAASYISSVPYVIDDWMKENAGLFE